MKKIRFYTFGCKVNQYDTQMMRTVVSSKFDIVDNDNADIYIINTCSVTAESERKARQLIRKINKEHPDSKIIVVGCYPQYNIDELKDMKCISVILSHLGKKNIVEYIEQIDKIEEPIVVTGEVPDEFWDLPIREFSRHTRAFIKIEDGCDNNCSYCVVPLVRGKPVSRPFDSVLNEIKMLEEKGVKEIVLSGIRLGRYSYDGMIFSGLVGKVLNYTSIPRIRMSSIELDDIDSNLIELLEKEERLCKHLHIPLQSGSDKILKLMNRRYSYEGYRERTFYLKKRVASLNLTTDIIVGFPGERDEDFQRSVSAVEEIGFGRVHIFSFSARDKTSADCLADKLPREIIKKRASVLRSGALLTTRKFKENFINKVMSVLIEGKTDSSHSYLQGFTTNYIRVKIDYNESLIGELVNVRLLNFISDDIYGKEV